MTIVVGAGIVTGIVLIAIRVIRQYTWGYFTEKVDLKGRVVIVTGCTSGIGYESVKELLRRNATVIMACRNPSKTKAAYDQLTSSIHTGELVTMDLDLCSLKSIRTFAKEVLAKYDKINILINNAGVAVQKFELTDEKFEMNMGVNHIGHFLLTNLLLDRIKQSTPSRIVVVSSSLHEKGCIDIDRLAEGGGGKEIFERRGRPYSNSKLANVYFTRELAQRVKDVEDLEVVSLCPGLCYTDIFRNAHMKWYQYILLTPIAFYYMRSANQGAQTVMHCAASSTIKGLSGKIFRNCTVYESSHKFDDTFQKMLWDKTEELIKSQE